LSATLKLKLREACLIDFLETSYLKSGQPGALHSYLAVLFYAAEGQQVNFLAVMLEEHERVSMIGAKALFFYQVIF
jgi:hypothetical protein